MQFTEVMVLTRYCGRVAVVTGASGGMGAVIAQALQRSGLNVVGLARRVDKVEALYVIGALGRLYGYQCDISNEKDILTAFKWIKEKLGGIDILVNCVGITIDRNLTEADTSQWRQVLDVNVLGLSILTREAVKYMKARQIDDGYVIHINSIEGHKSPMDPSLAMYYATKHAVRALAEGLRKDLIDSITNIRNTTISPGAVRTERVAELSRGYDSERLPFMDPQYIADMVIFVLSRPIRVQIQDIIVDFRESKSF